MPVPTISDISPAAGPAGGRNLVVITGTNFNDSQDVEPPVQVRFNGVDALETYVISDTEIRAVVPEFSGTGASAAAKTIPAVSLSIQNLDSNSDPIAGENVEQTSAYTYERSPLRDPEATNEQQVYRQVILEMIWTIQRQVIPNVAIGTSVDFGVTGEITIASAEAPGISLAGPRITEDLDSRHHWGDFQEREVSGENQFEQLWPGYLANFEFDAVLIATSRRELYAMIQAFHEMFMRTPFIKIAETYGETNGSKFEFPFVLERPAVVVANDADSDLLSAAYIIQVRWIPIRLDERVSLNERAEEAFLDVMADPTFNANSTPVEQIVIVEPKTHNIRVNDTLGLVENVTV